MILVLIRAINFFFQILIYLILGRAILSWFIRPNNMSLYKAYMIVVQLTEPILVPCRRLLDRFGIGGMIDFSPILAIIGLGIINRLIVNLLGIFYF